jgi:hypothetical protein
MYSIFFYNIIQYNTVQYNTIQYRGIWNFQIRPEPDLPDLDKNSGRIWDKPVMGTIGDKSVFKMAVYVFYYF